MKSLRKFILEEERLYGDDIMTEMSNLSQKYTNLPMLIWIESCRQTKHKIPRMKFENSYSTKLIPKELIPISIDKENPQILVDGFKLKIKNKDLEKLKDWIKLHYDDLMKVWNYEIDTVEFVHSLFL